jgi:ABC-2 type transport system permease protein
VDAYLQWTKNLSQLVLFAVIIMFGGAVSAEKKAGTAILVLTKPLSRAAFVTAKFVSQALLLVVTVTIGALLTWGVTYAVFGEAPIGTLAAATGSWLALGVLFVALMLMLSAMLDSQAGAAGIGFGAYILLSIGGLWDAFVKYTPVGLVNAPTELVTDKAGPLLWPVLSALALAALFVGVGIAVFRKREL